MGVLYAVLSGNRGCNISTLAFSCGTTNRSNDFLSMENVAIVLRYDKETISENMIGNKSGF